MSTRAQLRSRVRAYLDETAQAYWTDAELNEWINQAYFYYYLWIVQAFDAYFAQVVSIDIVGGQATYPFPANFFKVRLLERVYSTFTVPMRYFERNESANIIANTNFSSSYLPTYRFQGANFVLEPTPDQTITNGIRLEYVQEPVRMDLDADTPASDYSSMWEECIVLRAVISAKQKEESVANTGTDLASLSGMLLNWEQNMKESIEQRTSSRKYTEPFGIEDSYSFYP